MARSTRSQAALRATHPLRMQFGLAVSLALVIGAFTTPLPFSDGPVLLEHAVVETLQLEEIEQTRQHQPPPPPPQAPPPIEVPDEDVTEIVHIELDMDLDLNARAVVPPPPPPPSAPPPPPEPPPSAEPEIFTVVEQPPVLIGGLAEVQRRVRYPDIARHAGIEGTVHLQFVIDEQGRVVDPMCVREPGGGTCEAAIAAVRDARFEPGRQRGRAVKVRYAMPIRFRLQDG